MTSSPAPQLGYNTNVRHRGQVFHIQTEDSGIRHPHVVTHLFADGGRIVATRKTSYAEHVGDDRCAAHVKDLMQTQHRTMLVSLRDGVFDREISGDDAQTTTIAPPTTTADGRPASHYASLEPSTPSRPAPKANAELTIKTLDEVILSYLAGESIDGSSNGTP